MLRSLRRLLVGFRLPLHRGLTRLLPLLLPGRRRPGRATTPDGPVLVLLLTAYGLGGATRSVFNVTAQLARARPVELVCIVRKRKEPGLAFPEGVPLTTLDDRTGARSPAARVLGRLPSVLMHPDDDAYGWFSLWTDLLLLRRLRAVRGGTVLTSRPAVSSLAALVLRPNVALVVQEHTHLGALAGDMPAAVGRTYAGADAVVLLTERDREQYEALLGGRVGRVLAIPNMVSVVPGRPLPARERSPVVLAAGRMVPQKGFDLLVEAFAEVARQHPGWRLEVYGRPGSASAGLAAQVERTGLGDVVSLPGPTAAIGELMASSAVYALSSRYEGMPMVLLEAMSKGMSIIAFDCLTGPRELMTDGVDGVLVPPEDVPRLTEALLRVVGDVELRERLGAAALGTAARYAPLAVGDRWNRLLDDLHAAAPSAGA